MCAASLDTSVPVIPMAHRSQRLERRSVVDAVSGHGNVVPALLQHTHNPQLPLRGHTSVNANPLNLGFKSESGRRLSSCPVTIRSAGLATMPMRRAIAAAVRG
jgi:hypothetical protein